MAVIFKKKLFKGAKIGVWKIEENEEFFLSKMPLSAAELTNLQGLKGIRRLEWLACRWLLHELSGFPVRLPLAKDTYSKPFFENKENLICSLSHSRGVVAAMFCDLDDLPPARQADFLMGCDLQQFVSKMPMIAPKFMRDDEFAWVAQQNTDKNLALLHFFWTAKESMYKAYGKKEVDFKGHLRLTDFIFPKNKHFLYATGNLEKPQIQFVFEVFSEKIILEDAEDFLLTWCWTKDII